MNAKQRQQLEKLIAKLEPALAKEMLAALQNLRNNVNYSALRKALIAGDIEAALTALELEAGAFGTYLQSKASAYAQFGAAAAAAIPTRGTTAAIFRFNLSNPQVEQWLQTQASELIATHVQAHKDAIRALVVAEYNKGSGPNVITKLIAGTKTPSGRVGGMIGLSDPQLTYVSNMRARLMSGNPVEMQKVLARMTLRDKRFDATIRKFMAAGKPVPAEALAKMLTAYSDRLLKRRAEDIARTEVGMAVMASRKESYRQALDKAGLPDSAVTKRWRHGGADDKHARQDHIAMHNKTVVGLEQPFVLPDQTRVQHALDTTGGAKHNVNCRCSTDYIIDFSLGLS